MTEWISVAEVAHELGVSTDELRLLVLERGLSRREGPQGVFALRRDDLAGLFLTISRAKRGDKVSPE